MAHCCGKNDTTNCPPLITHTFVESSDATYGFIFEEPTPTVIAPTGCIAAQRQYRWQVRRNGVLIVTTPFLRAGESLQLGTGVQANYNRFLAVNRAAIATMIDIRDMVATTVTDIVTVNVATKDCNCPESGNISFQTQPPNTCPTPVAMVGIGAAMGTNTFVLHDTGAAPTLPCLANDRQYQWQIVKNGVFVDGTSWLYNDAPTYTNYAKVFVFQKVSASWNCFLAENVQAIYNYIQTVTGVATRSSDSNKIRMRVKDCCGDASAFVEYTLPVVVPVVSGLNVSVQGTDPFDPNPPPSQVRFSAVVTNVALKTDIVLTVVRNSVNQNILDSEWTFDISTGSIITKFYLQNTSVFQFTVVATNVAGTTTQTLNVSFP